MKKILLLLLLTSSSILVGGEDRLCIYLCARLNEQARAWNSLIAHKLGGKFDLFLPQDIDLSRATSASEIDKIAYDEDIRGMEKSDLLLVLPPYGRDCAWEMGWFVGSRKPTIAYVECLWDGLKDAMVFGGLDAIIISDLPSFKELIKNPYAMEKAYYIASRDQLAEEIEKIYRELRP